MFILWCSFAKVWKGHYITQLKFSKHMQTLPTTYKIELINFALSSEKNCLGVRRSFCSSYYEPSTVFKTKYLLTQLILWGSDCCYSNWKMWNWDTEKLVIYSMTESP